MRKSLFTMVMVVGIFVASLMAGCGAGGSTTGGNTTMAQSQEGYGEAVIKIPFSDVRNSAAVKAAKGGERLLATSDIVTKEKEKVTSVYIAIYKADTWEMVSEKDFDVVNGLLEAKIKLAAGSYRSYLSCSDADGNEKFFGTSDPFAVVVGQATGVVIPLSMDNITVEFIVAGMQGNFTKSLDQGEDGNVYVVKTKALSANGDPQYDEDNYAYVDENGALHFFAWLQILPDVPVSITATVTDASAAVINQTFALDSEALLGAIYTDQPLTFAFQQVGTVNITVTFPN